MNAKLSNRSKPVQILGYVSQKREQLGAGLYNKDFEETD